MLYEKIREELERKVQQHRKEVEVKERLELSITRNGIEGLKKYFKKKKDLMFFPKLLVEERYCLYCVCKYTQ